MGALVDDNVGIVGFVVRFDVGSIVGFDVGSIVGEIVSNI